MRDYRRMLRVVCDILAAGAGGFCAFGAVCVDNPTNLNTCSVLLLAIFGGSAGLTLSATENRIARGCAAALTVGMVACHLYIQFQLFQLGLFVAIAEPMIILSVPTIVLILVQATDWCVRRGNEPTTQRRKHWFFRSTKLRWLDIGMVAFLRCVSCLVAVIKWLGAGLLVAYAIADTLPVDMKLASGLALTLLGGTWFTFSVWLFTRPTRNSSSSKRVPRRDELEKEKLGPAHCEAEPKLLPVTR